MAEVELYALIESKAQDDKSINQFFSGGKEYYLIWKQRWINQQMVGGNGKTSEGFGNQLVGGRCNSSWHKMLSDDELIPLIYREDKICIYQLSSNINNKKAATLSMLLWSL